MKSETTSKRVSAIAGKVLANTKGLASNQRLLAMNPDIAQLIQQLLNGIGYTCRDLGSVADEREVCGSALTQAPDLGGQVLTKGRKRR